MGAPPYRQLVLDHQNYNINGQCIAVVGERLSQRCRRLRICSLHRATAAEKADFVRYSAELLHEELTEGEQEVRAQRVAELSVCTQCKSKVEQVKKTMLQQLTAAKALRQPLQSAHHGVATPHAPTRSGATSSAVINGPMVKNERLADESENLRCDIIQLADANKAVVKKLEGRKQRVKGLKKHLEKAQKDLEETQKDLQEAHDHADGWKALHKSLRSLMVSKVPGMKDTIAEFEDENEVDLSEEESEEEDSDDSDP